MSGDDPIDPIQNERKPRHQPFHKRTVTEYKNIVHGDNREPTESTGSFRTTVLWAIVIAATPTFAAAAVSWINSLGEYAWKIIRNSIWMP